MIVAKIKVNGVSATADYRKTITAGMIGAQVQIDYAADPWDGLHKTVVFRGAVTKDVITNAEVVTIPAEVVAKQGAALRIGVYGVDEEGNLAIPTLWADLGNIRDAADPSGDPSTDPSLPVWAKLQAMIGDLDKLNTTAKNNLVLAVNEALTKGGGSVDEAEIKRIVDAYLAANPPKVTETDPTVPAWAMQPQKPTYTAKEVGALPDTYTPPNQTAQQVGADPAGTAATAVSQHNTDTAAHNDLRLALQELANRVNAALDSDDTTLDQLSEIVTYIKSNKTLIDATTTSKVSVGDIVNDLVTNVANKPLSAAQGVVLKGLIDAIGTGGGTAVQGADAWSLLANITLQEDSDIVTISSDQSGSPFSCKKIMAIISFKASSDGNPKSPLAVFCPIYRGPKTNDDGTRTFSIIDRTDWYGGKALYNGILASDSNDVLAMGSIFTFDKYVGIIKSAHVYQYSSGKGTDNPPTVHILGNADNWIKRGSIYVDTYNFRETFTEFTIAGATVPAGTRIKLFGVNAS